ncbi:phosphate uptake regulator PhoU [Halodesulfurarchaeum formicicum]|uniref:Phosphate uptake regulator PhoU n=1 Tax=Halodesulfurarchaeum formicicum TaxID=1873524 RepID=A0A1D8S4N1_9EURY|nr:phosphate uptake regulator PhoU [Halodesulfurarchaeum formicicum]AOW80306.1 phosphate uptake regulator PhoU [Halodesulfurarchaeum formicicum]APE95609.1 phosphate uptake regulator PhoU [Halodesulfurarchaeum formicicum]
MDTRKVQRLGPSTLAMTLPAKWARENGVEKGDEVTVRTSAEGTLSVTPESARGEETEATITVGDFDADAVERAIIGQYVLGRRVIHVTAEDTLEGPHINAVYDAESQLMGLGVIEETPERITIRCSVDPEDFDLANLLTRLENTGRTMRNEAMKALARNNHELAERALNRERQANKIFVLLLRLIFTAYRNPSLARTMGLSDGFPLIAYRSVAKNLELIADNAENMAEIVLDADDDRLGLDDPTVRRIRDHTERVDELTEMAVEAIVSRDFETAREAQATFMELSERELGIMRDLPELSKKRLLQIREVLVALQQTAEHAVRIVEIASNLALNESSEFTTIS